jgi:hypothetical protein
MNDRNSSSTRTSLPFAVVGYCRRYNIFFSGDYSNLLRMSSMKVKMAVMEVEDDGCDENVGGVCMWFVGRDSDGDDIHCRAGRKGIRKHHGRLIP